MPIIYSQEVLDKVDKALSDLETEDNIGAAKAKLEYILYIMGGNLPMSLVHNHGDLWKKLRPPEKLSVPATEEQNQAMIEQLDHV